MGTAARQRQARPGAERARRPGNRARWLGAVARDRGPPRHLAHRLWQSGAEPAAEDGAPARRGGDRVAAPRSGSQADCRRRVDRRGAGSGYRRSRSPPAGRLESAVERDQVHAGWRARNGIPGVGWRRAPSRPVRHRVRDKCVFMAPQRPSLRPAERGTYHSAEMTARPPNATSSRLPLVLIVEDDPETRQFYSDALAADGFATDQAHNGHQAFAKALEIGPDLILTDIAVPGLDGIELCRRLRADTRTRAVPVLAITGYG